MQWRNVGPCGSTPLCGDNNGPGIRLPFYELDSQMAEPNAAGWRITNFARKDGSPMKLRVEGDRLIGESPTQGTIEGEGLIDSQIRVVVGADQTPYILTISGFGLADYWVRPSPSNRVPHYGIRFEPEDRSAAPQELCRNTVDPEWDSISGDAVIFTGDRYDANTLEVRQTSDKDRWFNVACPGTAMAKMHFYRHTLASSLGNKYQPEVPHRQALLRMFSADYCGTGRNFTVDGQRIAFNFGQDWFPQEWEITDFNSPAYDSPEAVWRDDGAYCLSEPRLQAKEPEILNKIAEECASVGRPLPAPCTEDDLAGWRQHGYAVLMNPAAPPP